MLCDPADRISGSTTGTRPAACDMTAYRAKVCAASRRAISCARQVRRRAGSRPPQLHRRRPGAGRRSDRGAAILDFEHCAPL